MAFLKHARADVTQPSWSIDYWGNFVQRARGRVRTASSSPNLVAQASDILQDQFSPEKYLLTHATIVASVDTSEVSNVKLGNVSEMGRRVNRRWANYRILPKCDIYINNNHDAWDRPVLLKSYRTFVGAHNFVEHVQIEDQSKGRIIDAAARDIGDSVYVDILIATNRRHASLIRDIESGRMGTMSMGCSVTETICTKCGNVAADETEMCEHVKYGKGQYEYDQRGNKFRVAELCGHETLDPTGGVTFIEASWVAVPAFQGAVMRNILQPDSINLDTRSQMHRVLSEPPRQWTANEDEIAKAARDMSDVSFEGSKTAAELAEERRQARLAQLTAPPGDDAGGGMPGMPGMPGDPGGGDDADPMKDLEDAVEKYVLDKIKKKLRDKMQGDDEEDESSPAELETSTNENVNHQAARTKLAAGTEALLRIARSDVELIDGIARLERSHDIEVSRDLYRTALRVGSTDGHPSLDKYLARCAEVLGRKPQTGEAKTLVRLGRILSLRKKTRF
jgi:hypothetical protein